MFYFGRIISAFFNQLFRFLLWNKFGQKLLIIIIISLLAFWCLGMTKVHAVESVSDINYEMYNYYENVINDAIVRLSQEYIENPDHAIFSIIKNNSQNFIWYFYYGNSDGSSYQNAKPLSTRNLNIIYFNNWNRNNVTYVGTAYDYLGITGKTLYNISINNGSFNRIIFSSSVLPNSASSITSFYAPEDLFGYVSENWTNFMNYINNNDTQQIISLMQDIKAEQQATNDFLNEDTDTSNMVIDTPSVTDETSDNMSNNLHNQINTLTTNLQNTVNNYYEGWNAYTWSIPLPAYIGGNITFDSGVTRRIIGTSGVVYNIIQAIWVVLFGGYIVGFIKRMLDWVQTGKIFDEGGIADFIWWMDTNNEIIKASMM